MRNILITVVICGLVLVAGSYINRHFAPAPSLERQLPGLDDSFRELIHLTSHESLAFAFYSTHNQSLGVAVLEPGNKQARLEGVMNAPSRRGSRIRTTVFPSLDLHFAYGMIDNPVITEVAVSGTPCTTLPLQGDVKLVYCFSDESFAPLEIEGKIESGTIQFRSTFGH